MDSNHPRRRRKDGLSLAAIALAASEAPPPVALRLATHHDCGLVGRWNHALIREEGRRNPMTVEALETRAREWVASGEYRVHLLVVDHESIGYICWRSEGPREVYVRQFFVIPSMRRRGIGRAAVANLRGAVWPAGARVSLDVLASNPDGSAFWRALGFAEYSTRLEQLGS